MQLVKIIRGAAFQTASPAQEETLDGVCASGDFRSTGKHRRILGIFSMCSFGNAKYGLKTMEAGDVTRIKSVRVRFCSCGEERWEEV